ncbi:hypothetical protein JCM4020_27480 [Streptomyces coelicolor]|nr:hypothetical protein JCM4020_27480 [Streptomyces coelicolor]
MHTGGSATGAAAARPSCATWSRSTPTNQYWCEECARALIIKGDPIETYRELEGEPIYGRLLEEHCTLKRFYSFVTA